jgi:hypothetical protein
MADFVCGRELAVSPHGARCAANLRPAAALGVAGRGDWYVTDDLLLSHVDRSASFMAADARKMVAALAAARAKLSKPALQGVLLLGANQRLCSKVDTPARARTKLAAAGIAVYRLR